ncbi:MAG: NCS2 family permease, partial [Actinobacteria bacterium]|nr:NCS2 family permease [Actinomycetota bacterium]
GAAAGGRTGLTSVVTGLLFIVFAFLSPLVGMVGSSATCGALVIVGYLMMTDINKIGWDDVAEAFPAFITIIGIPMTYSITNGIGLGFISFCIIKCIQGKFKDIHPLMWVAALAFLVTFIFT